MMKVGVDESQDWEREAVSAFNRELAAVLDRPSLTQRLREALEYSVLAPGKRVRPLLSIALRYDLTGNYDLDFVRRCTSLELLHAASLVHDDLPALDNDDIRRGRPSCHMAFDESTAILVGDYLVPLAIQVLATGTDDPLIRTKTIEFFTERFLDLLHGQFLDTASAMKPDLTEVARLKTGALFSAVCALPFLTDRRFLDNEAIVSHAEELGLYLGLAFQIADDLDDHMHAHSDPHTERNFFTSESSVAALSLWRDTDVAIRKKLSLLEGSLIPSVKLVRTNELIARVVRRSELEKIVL